MAVKEGYLLIDHHASPGTDLVPEGTIIELATLTCSHCKTVQIKNPFRVRDRGHCWKCNHYVCDTCAAIPECRPFNQVVDDVLDGKTPIPILVSDLRKQNG